MRKDSLGLAVQTALGTKQTVMGQFPPVESVEIKDLGASIESDETTGTRAPARIEKGVKLWELTAKGSLRPASGPRILSGFMGTPVITQPDNIGAPTAYSFLFNPVAAAGAGDPLPHSLQVARVDPNPGITDLFWDCMGDGLKLAAQPNGFLNFEAAYLALDRDADLANPSPTFDTSTRWTFDKAHVFTSVNGGAETELPVAAWGLDFSNALARDAEILGQRKLQTLDAGDLAAELSFTAKDKTQLRAWYDRAYNDDPDAVKIRMTATGAVIGGAVAFKVEVIAFLAEVLEAPAGIDAGNRLTAVPIKARAALDSATSKFVTVEIVKTGNTL